MASHLQKINDAVISLGGAESDSLAAARAAVAEALHACFLEISTSDASHDERKVVDVALSADAAALKVQS